MIIFVIVIIKSSIMSFLNKHIIIIIDSINIPKGHLLYKTFMHL